MSEQSTYHEIQPGFFQFPAAGPVSANIRLGAGEIRVRATDATIVTVRVSPHDNSEGSRTGVAATTVQLQGDQLVVVGPEHQGWIFRRGARLSIEIELPLGSRVRTESGAADVFLDGDLAGVVHHSGAGDLHVARVTGDLESAGGSGDVRVQHVSGDLRVKTASGDAAIGFVGGDADVDTASGDVHIDDVGGAARASTASGDIRVGVVRGKEMRARSASGDVQVGVPIGTKVWLDLVTVAGSTRTDLEVTSQQPEGGPQLTVKVNTVSGDITVRRTALPPRAAAA
jgi:hypothetical protein